MAGRASKLNTMEISDDMLPELIKDKAFHPGLRGTSMMKKCMALGFKPTTKDMLDVMRQGEFDDVIGFYAENKFDPSKQESREPHVSAPVGTPRTLVDFCPKSVALMKWLSGMELTMDPDKLFISAALNGCVDSAVCIAKEYAMFVGDDGIPFLQKAYGFLKRFPTPWSKEIKKEISNAIVTGASGAP
jgi:hypothetical protein